MKPIHLLIALALFAGTLTSCSSEKGLGKTITAQINLKLPKDSSGNPISIRKATIKEAWPAVEPFYTSIEGLVLLLPNLPDNIGKNIVTLHAAINLAILQIQPGAGYTGIKDGAVKAVYLQIDKYIWQVEDVFAIYLSSDVSWLIHNIRTALNYVVYGDGVASPLYGIPALR